MSTPGAANRWLLSHKTNPDASLRLFCFPYAGGAANVFRNWSAGLPSTVDVCPVQLPGRGSRLREPPFTKIPLLVQTVAGELLSHWKEPFALFGQSMGAIISFELARYLRNEYNILPVHLFVSGSRAPQRPNPASPIFDLPQNDFLDELRRLNGTPQEVLENPELIQLMLPLLRADFELIGTYSYSVQPRLDCPITAFGGLRDPEVSRDDVEAWREQTSARFSIRMLPGDHFFLNTARPFLLEMLSQELAQTARA